MSKKQFQVTLTDPKAPKGSELIQAIPGAGAEPVRIKAQPNGNYLITDKSTGRAPQQVHARRKNKDLLIQLDEYRADGSPDLIVENFYEMAPGSFAGVAEDSVTYPFVPNTAQEGHQFASLIDGGQIAHVLGALPATTVAASPLVAAAGFAGLGGVAAAGAGALGLAALAGGGGGGSKSSPATTGTTPGGSNPTPKLVTVVNPTDKLDTKIKDGKLSHEEIKEDPSKDGLTYELNFNSPPGSEFKEDDLVVKGGTIQPGSLKQVGEDGKRYTFVVIPDADTQDGTLEVGLMENAFIDSATGKPNTAQQFPSVKFDTQALKVKSWSTNIDELEKGVAGGKAAVTGAKDDDVLNIAEAEAGLRVSVQLNEAPSSPLTKDHFAPSVGTIRQDTFAWNATTLTASFIVDPPKNTAGTARVGWRETGLKLTDSAGNLLLVDEITSPLPTFEYDLRTPTFSVTGPTTTQGYALAQNSDLQIDFKHEGAALDSVLSKVTLLGNTKPLPSGNSPLEIKDGLKDLADGFYTLSFDLTDIYGNKLTLQQVLEKDVNAQLEDQWTNSNTQTGTSKSEYFIDRPGSSSYDGGSGSDTFVWLKAFSGTSSQTDRDTIKNFQIGQSSAASEKDVINLIDLFGAAPDGSGNNLAKYLQVKQVDKDSNNSVDETRLYINHLGKLNDTTSASLDQLEATATQVIVLDGINKSLDELVKNGNLAWTAPIL